MITSKSSTLSGPGSQLALVLTEGYRLFNLDKIATGIKHPFPISSVDQVTEPKIRKVASFEEIKTKKLVGVRGRRSKMAESTIVSNPNKMRSYLKQKL